MRARYDLAITGEYMSKFGRDFAEIGQSGGQFTVTTKTGSDGRRSISMGMRHIRPVPMTAIGICALPQGIPVKMAALGGMGPPTDCPSGCYVVLVSSDSLGMFGRSCPSCKGYWRSTAPSAMWNSTCAYCGIRAEGHHFLTEGQRAFIKGFCQLVGNAMDSEQDGEHVINMDAVAEAVGKGQPKPAFYYTDEKQQNHFACNACGANNDILGVFGYCASCGTSNGSQVAEGQINELRRTMATAANYSQIVKEAVSVFDSYARHIAKQLVANVPMTSSRKKLWSEKLFHNLRKAALPLREHFDIDVLHGLKQDEVEFASKMFLRRHVYEHNGGEVDQKYIDESGDSGVRLKQAIRETKDSASDICNLVVKMSKNLHAGFHQLFPPEEMPIKIHLDRQGRRRAT